jgi:hypothetical protein
MARISGDVYFVIDYMLETTLDEQSKRDYLLFNNN